MPLSQPLTPGLSPSDPGFLLFRAFDFGGEVPATSGPCFPKTLFQGAGIDAAVHE